MKISSVNPNFQGRRDNRDVAINLDDNSVRQLAWAKTASETDYKKDRKISDALIYSAPIAAGFANAVLSKENTAVIFSKQLKNLAARTAIGLKTATGWAAGLAMLDVMRVGLNGLRNKSETYKNFDNSHPFASTALNIAGAFGLLALVDKGVGKLGKLKAPKFLSDATEYAGKFINTNKNIKSAKKFISKNLAVLPESVKNTGKFALSWAAPALILAGVLHGIRAAAKINGTYNQNYQDMKEAQAQLAKARLRELSLENDFLMQDAQNREDVAIVKNAAKGLTEKV